MLQRPARAMATTPQHPLPERPLPLAAPRHQRRIHGSIPSLPAFDRLLVPPLRAGC